MNDHELVMKALSVLGACEDGKARIGRFASAASMHWEAEIEDWTWLLGQVDKQGCLALAALKEMMESQINAEFNPRRDALDAECNQRRDALDAEFDPRWDALDAEFDPRRYALKAEFNQRRYALNAEFDPRWDALNAECNQRRYALNAEFNQRRYALNAEFSPRWNALKAELDPRRAALDAEFNQRRAALNKKLLANLRNQYSLKRLRAILKSVIRASRSTGERPDDIRIPF
jgi:malate synthase